jgi:hypothetical protein
VALRTIRRFWHPRTGINAFLLFLSTTTELVVLKLIPQHDPQPDSELESHGHARLPESFLDYFAAVKAFQLRIPACDVRPNWHCELLNTGNALAQLIERGSATKNQVVAILHLREEQAMLASCVFPLAFGEEGSETGQPLLTTDRGRSRSPRVPGAGRGLLQEGIGALGLPKI